MHPRSNGIAFAFALAFSAILASPTARANGTEEMSRHPGGRALVDSYTPSLLRFEPNVGQADPRFPFLARARGFDLLVAPAETVLDYSPGSSSEAVHLTLVGANPDATVEGRDLLRSKSNYFIGSDPRQWRTGVPHYGRLVTSEVYPGVSLLYYGNEGQLEYDLVVTAGADPRQIRYTVRGVEAMRLDEIGNVLLQTRIGTVIQKAPVAYQEVAGRRRTIESRYELIGGNEIRLALGAYDHGLPLVIDPVLSYSTFVGGSSGDEPRGIARGNDGAIYVSGYTGTPSTTPFPTTPGAHQDSYAGGNKDAFVAKLNPGGGGAADLVYSTYLGGFGDDGAWGIAVDDTGAAYIVGDAGGSFPTTAGAFQRSGDSFSGFLVKLDPTGGLAYGTLLGGGAVDTARGVALDASGSVLVTGFTSSVSPQAFPTTVGAYQTTRFGFFDAYVAKINPAGLGTSDLIYATLFGGPGTDLAQRVTVHDSSVYIAGYTSGSGTLPTTVGAYQRFSAGAEDAFLARFDPAGQGNSDLLYATYLGGSGTDLCFGLAVDSSANAYLAGYTTSAGAGAFPTTPGAYQTSIGGPFVLQDAFVAKISPRGGGNADLVYSTYIGGPFNDAGLNLALDDRGMVYLTGIAASEFPTTPDAYQQVSSGEFDAFLSKLNPAGGSAADLLYSTFFGGTDNDHAYAVAVDGEGQTIDVAGSSFGTIPTTAGAYQGASGGSLDVFLARFGTPPTPIDFFLHGSGSAANPRALRRDPCRERPAQTCFLDGTPPSGSSATYSASSAVRFAGGNPWSVVGTWSASPESTNGTLVGFDDLHAWLGLTNSGDQDARFDLRAEVLKNGTLIASGEAHCIQGVKHNPGSAREIALPFAPMVATPFDGTTDVLSLRVMTRIGTDGVSSFCGGDSSAAGLRVYYDATNRLAGFQALRQ
jgi:hypothetical protein